MNITKNLTVTLVLTFMLTSTTVFAFTISGAGLTLTTPKLTIIGPPAYTPVATHPTYTLDILTDQSEVKYRPFIRPIDEPEKHTFKISGKFRLIVDNDSFYKTVLWLKPIEIDWSPLPTEPFTFPTFPIAYDGLNFSDTGDVCNYTNCGNFGSLLSLQEEYVSGSFDGNFLEMTGSIKTPFSEPYSYTIRASVFESAPVPEPSTIVLFGSAAAGLCFIRYRKCSKSNCRELRKERQ